ncbi:unnamed protein product, partial [Effrenium voratum]
TEASCAFLPRLRASCFLPPRAMGRQHLAKVQLFQEWFLKKHSLDLFLPWKPEAVEDGEEFGIELRADEHGGTGVYARHRLQPGEVLAQIPTSALLYSARARQALPASCATLPLTEEELLGGGA